MCFCFREEAIANGLIARRKKKKVVSPAVQRIIEEYWTGDGIGGGDEDAGIAARDWVVRECKRKGDWSDIFE